MPNNRMTPEEEEAYVDEWVKGCQKERKAARAPNMVPDPLPAVTIDEAIIRLSDVHYNLKQGNIDHQMANALTNALKASIAAMRERTTDEAEKMMDQLDQGARVIGPSRPVLVLANPEKDDPEPES